ncbi:MAG: aminotransferase class V-fold PLP-dependent enzyme [Actinomycetota bacterium]|nr:aminotransferase class V-fold PLP-dependent enzyme [Actinomycetota bacterium]
MIYLDNAATSFPKPPPVLAALKYCLNKIGANPGRGQYKTALAAGRLVVETRELLAGLLGVANPADIVFTANATESLNLAIKGWVRPGDTVVTTSIEHNSVYRPLAFLARKYGVKTITAKSLPDGGLDLKDLRRLVKKSTRLVVVAHASNVIGNILPLGDIVEITRKAGAPLLVDAAQTAGCIPLDIEAMGIDMLAFTGHKALLGPQGTGGLYISPDLDVEELKQGGTGSMSKEDQPKFRPDRYESGTMNTLGLAGLGAAVKFILDAGVKNICSREQFMMTRLINGLEQVKGLAVFGPPAAGPRAALASVSMAGISAHQLAFLLDKRFDIAARAGFHCAPVAHRAIGTYESGTLRLSPGYFSTDDDIDAAIDALAQISHDLG